MFKLGFRQIIYVVIIYTIYTDNRVTDYKRKVEKYRYTVTLFNSLSLLFNLPDNEDMKITFENIIFYRFISFI